MTKPVVAKLRMRPKSDAKPDKATLLFNLMVTCELATRDRGWNEFGSERVANCTPFILT